MSDPEAINLLRLVREWLRPSDESPERARVYRAVCEFLEQADGEGQREACIGRELPANFLERLS